MAKTYLDGNDVYTLATSNTTIYGSNGSERVILQSGVTGTTLDQNVEQVSLAAAKSSYSYQQSGNALLVYSGSTLVIRLTVQETGTSLQFTDGAATTAFSAGKMLLGGSVVATDAPGPLGSSSSTTTTSLLSKAQALNSSISSIDTGLLTSSSPIVQGMIFGTAVKWNSSALTYSFPAQMPSDYAGNASYSTNWSALNSAEQTAARSAFSKLAEIIPITFTETSGTGDLRFSVVDQTSAGFAVSPVSTPYSTGVDGDVFLSTSNRSGGTQYAYSPGDAGFKTVLHEIGHAVGLKHPFETPVVPAGNDSDIYSLMSYTEVRNAVLNFSVSGNSATYTYSFLAMPDNYAVNDIAALQSQYGTNGQTRSGNDSYTVSSHGYKYLCIWDGGGKDTINASSATGVCSINLNPGTFSSVDTWSLSDQKAATNATLSQQGFNNATWINAAYDKYASSLYTGENNLSIAYGVIIENVTTGSASDTVTDNKVDNLISTGAGNDTINLGAGGYDTVDGGEGTDVVVLAGVTRSQVQQEKLADGGLLLLAPSFAVKLVGVESVTCSDGALTLLT